MNKSIIYHFRSIY